MIQIAKKVSIFGFVLFVSGVGVSVGQNLSRQTAVQHLARVSPQSNTSAPATGQQERYENLELFNRVLHFIEGNYVKDVKNKDLVYGAIKGMLETLDPHSNFLPPDLYKDMQIDTSGKFGGLGIEIGMKDNVLTILAPIEDTPAWKAGLKPNDRIVKINSESTKGMSLVEAVSKMRGKPKTDVTLSIYRDGFEKLKDVTVTRDIIKIQSVKNEVLEPQYGYVRLTTFNENAAADVRKAIEEMNKKGKLRGLVFDLRMNPGGLLEQAVEVASLFIDGGVVVSTIGRNPDIKEVKHARKGVAFKDLPVAVLVNSSTASAAEIVAGALQHHRRAIIMGQPTFGKGSVQTVIPLSNDKEQMGLKLTIAEYFVGDNVRIQGNGVKPDIMLDAYDPKLLTQARLKEEAFREKDLKGHLVTSDEEKSHHDDFKKEELEMLAQGGSKDKKKGSDKSSDDKASKDADDMTPYRMNPKEDFQVKEALNALKSYEVFKKITFSEKALSVAAEK